MAITSNWFELSREMVKTCASHHLSFYIIRWDELGKGETEFQSRGRRRVDRRMKISQRNWLHLSHSISEISSFTKLCQKRHFIAKIKKNNEEKWKKKTKKLSCCMYTRWSHIFSSSWGNKKKVIHKKSQLNRNNIQSH